jgi:hypothetical protein
MFTLVCTQRYCSAACQKNHWPIHKKECKLRAAELRDEALFKDPQDKEECPICFLPMPTLLKAVLRFHRRLDCPYQFTISDIEIILHSLSRTYGIDTMVQWKDMSICASEIQYLEMYDDTHQQQQRIPELEGIALMDSLNTIHN